MAIAHYLAMTATEMETATFLPPSAAWMACHFSPYSTGLTNLPRSLPENSLLILNDRTPIHGHDPAQIAQELGQVLERDSCIGLLMDFQNPKNRETEILANYLAEKLSCPMGITPSYSIEGAATFLPPVPTDMPPEEYLAPWDGKKIWLETALDGKTISLTPQGAAFQSNQRRDYTPAHQESGLHCHYSIQLEAGCAIFHTWRTSQDLEQLLQCAQNHGAELAVGLYQEFSQWAAGSSSVISPD